VGVQKRRFNLLKLKEILLLILRTLFLVFLIVSLARPFTTRTIFTLPEFNSTIIILDDSYSMQHQNLFSAATNKIGGMVGKVLKKSEVSIISSSFSLNMTSGSLNDHKKLLASLNSFTSSFGDHSLKAAFFSALLKLQNAQHQDKKIIILTDLQDRAVRELLPFLKSPLLPSNTDIIFIDLGKDDCFNISLEEIFLLPPVPLPNEESKIGIRVRNYNAQGQDVMLTLLIKKLPSPQTFLPETIVYKTQVSLSLNPHEAQELFFPFVFSSGIYKIEGRLEKDSLEADNHYFYSVKVNPKVPVLLVAENEDDARYLKLALKTAFDVTTITPQELSKINLSPFKVIGLLSCERLSYENFLRLKNYQAQGGALFITLLSPISFKWWPILNLKLNLDGYEVNLKENEFVVINKIDTLNPITRPFKNSNLASAQFFNYYALKDPPQSSAPLYFSSETPFLLIAPDQKIIIAFTKFTPQATNLVFKTEFPILIYSCFSELGLKETKTNYLVNDTINLLLNSNNPIKVITPNKVYYETTFSRTPEGFYLLKFSDTKVPGFYKLGENWYSVNVNPKEGDLKRISYEELKKYNVKIFKKYLESPKDLTFFFLILAGCFLTLEMLLLLLR
jgi:hypothetical protein